MTASKTNFDTNFATNFDKRLLIEQIRYIEKEKTLDYDVEEVPGSRQHDFEGKLYQRAQYLVDRYDLGSSLEQAAKRFRYANAVALIIAALLGALGITYAITDVIGSNHTINIYGLLLVLLGFNFISMLLWLIGVSLNMEGLTSGALARLTSWLSSHFGNKNNPDSEVGAQADRAWLACHFSDRVGKWQFSRITHRLWLVYLFTGLIFLVLLLMVRQYDFVWGTTLLSDNIFVKLTDVLSAPLQVLGFTTPTLEQIQDTRIGVEQLLTAEHRSHWAQFLLGALLCFGILPRILFWFWSVLMHTNARRHFTLDYYLPYYIRLRQQLVPLATHGQIVDADTSPPVVSETPTKTTVQHALPDVLLEKAKWVAVEPGNNINWPPSPVTADNNLGQIIDRDSMKRILDGLQQTRSVIAVAVSAARPPDRGVQRMIAQLTSSSEQCWLVLLKNNEDEAIATTRLAAWYRLAETCGIAADHVISMSAN